MRGLRSLRVFPLHPRVSQGICNHLFGGLDAQARDLQEHHGIGAHPVAFRLGQSIQGNDHRLLKEAQARDASLLGKAIGDLNEILHLRGVREHPGRAHRPSVQRRRHLVRGGDPAPRRSKDNLQMHRVKAILVGGQASRAAVNIVIHVLIGMLRGPTALTHVSRHLPLEQHPERSRVPLLRFGRRDREMEPRVRQPNPPRPGLVPGLSASDVHVRARARSRPGPSTDQGSGRERLLSDLNPLSLSGARTTSHAHVDLALFAPPRTRLKLPEFTLPRRGRLHRRGVRRRGMTTSVTILVIVIPLTPRALPRLLG